MQKKWMSWASSVPVCALIVFSGCAAGPRLKDYPQRQIDRPLTVPKGVASWQIPVIAGVVKDNAGSNTLFPVPYPLIWETALSDDWMLTWFPLPLAVTYQVSNNANERFGVMGIAGFRSTEKTNGDSQLSFQPAFHIQYRKKMEGGNWALDFDPSLTFEFGNGDTRWNTHLSVGPFFQLTNETYLKPSVGLLISKGSGLFGPYYRGILDASQTVASFTPSLAMGTVLSDQWDFDAGYSYLGIGADNGLSAHVFVLNFTHRW